MTYAFATRSWALAQMHLYIFGRDTIAEACNVPPRTLATWYRSDLGKLPSLLKTPREDQRALGLVLLNRFPEHKEEIAQLVHTKPRTLLEWRQFNNSTQYRSDLFERTRQAFQIYDSVIDQYVVLGIDGALKLIRGKLPDAYMIYQPIWQEYDDNLELTVDLCNILKFYRYASNRSFLGGPPIPNLDERIRRISDVSKRITGPHALRNSTFKPDTYQDFSSETEKRRIKGRFGGKANLSISPWEYRIANTLRT
jgi:hypothetical protein